MTIRKALSKKTRFDVFKRDAFACQYCGAHPPGVLLHVDHVVAVASGGNNSIDNLVTACQPCNAGKGARALDVVPQTLAGKAALVAEREAQILGYQAILDGKKDRVDAEMRRVAEILDDEAEEKGPLRTWAASIRRFNEALGVHVVLEAAESASSRFSGDRGFRYFCGICWNLVREAEKTNA